MGTSFEDGKRNEVYRCLCGVDRRDEGVKCRDEAWDKYFGVEWVTYLPHALLIYY
jgi:hypothetical protein